MYEDVIDLRDFYQSSLGRTARRLVRRRIRELWPDTRGAALLGAGYAVPYLGPFLTEAERVIACMPPIQGVMRWPPLSGNDSEAAPEPNRVLLSDETALPFASGSFDRVLVVHGLERSESMRAFLREIWRVLTPSGRLLVVVPNRRGIWARLERTPFGDGSPFTPAQLARLLRETLFTPERTVTALSMPPSTRRMWLTTATAWEEIGQRWFASLSGVILTEATKQIYAVPPPTPAWSVQTLRRPLAAAATVQKLRIDQRP